MKKTLSIFFLTFLSSFPLLANKASKPSMTFLVEYEGSRKENFLQLIQLQYNTAQDLIPADTITTIGCDSPEKCLSSKDYAAFHKLMFVFPDDTLFSPMFGKNATNSIYKIKVSDSGISVVDKTPWFSRDDNPYAFYRVSIITIIIEVLGLFVVLLIFGYPDKMRFMLAVFLANLVSLPVFTFGILGLSNSLLGWLFGMVFVILFESFFVWFFMKKPASIGKMIMLVVFLNFLSMLAGGAFMFFNMTFGREMNAWFI
jgi:hypothetical protein